MVELLSAELLFPGRPTVCRVYCDGHGKRGPALVAIPFEWGIRKVHGMVQTIPIRLIRVCMALR